MFKNVCKCIIIYKPNQSIILWFWQSSLFFSINLLKQTFHKSIFSTRWCYKLSRYPNDEIIIMLLLNIYLVVVLFNVTLFSQILNKIKFNKIMLEIIKAILYTLQCIKINKIFFLK